MSRWKKMVAAMVALPMLAVLAPAANADSVIPDTLASAVSKGALNQSVQAQLAGDDGNMASGNTSASLAVQTDALEDNGGITVASGDTNAVISGDTNFGKVLTITGSWVSGTQTDNVPTKAVGVFKDPTVFNHENWTLFSDVKLTEPLAPTDANWNSKGAFTIGTKDKYVSLLLGNGKLYAGGETFALAKTATVGVWSSVAISYSEAGGIGSIAVYIDGEQVLAPTAINFQLSALSGVRAFIGHKYATSFISNGVYDNIVVDDTTVDEATAKQITADRVLEKIEASSWEGVSLPKQTASNVVLPAANDAGDPISWTSGNTAVLTDDGRLIATLDKDTAVTFTASITKDGKTFTRDFTVSVLSDPTSAQVDLDAIDLGVIGYVYGSITLPAKGSVFGNGIVWKSSDPSVITDKTNDDGLAAGVVTRPKDADKVVVLTASIPTVGITRRFVVTVKKRVERVATTDYLFAHFTGTEGRSTDEQIYFATSHNGLDWVDTHTNTHPVLTWEQSQTGNSRGKDNGVRDPYLVRSADGDTVYLIATELSIYNRGGWGSAAATTTGSPNLIVWKSHDMVHWSKPYAVDVASKIPGGAGCAWAPEAYWDDVNQQYIVYWASRTDGNNELGDGMNMYYATTRDFVTFSDPVKWIDRGVSVIDTTMMKVGDWYYRASGDGQNSIEKSKDPYAVSVSDTAMVENPTKDENQWQYVGALQDILNNTNYSGSKLEGPEFFAYNSDDIQTVNGKRMPYGLMWDQYADGKGYLPFFTSDPGSASADDWSVATSVNFNALKKRHGTILPLTSTEYDAIMAAYNGKDDVSNLIDDAPAESKSLTVLNDQNAEASDVTVKFGDSTTLTAVVDDPDDKSHTVTWEPADSSIVSTRVENPKDGSVNANTATFTGTKVGWTTVTASTAEDPTLKATFVINVTKADLHYEALQAAIAAAQSKQQSDFTPESWKALANALTHAKAMLTEENAQQSDIDAASAALVAATKALVPVTDANPAPNPKSDAGANQGADNVQNQTRGKVDSIAETGSAVASIAVATAMLLVLGVMLLMGKRRT